MRLWELERLSGQKHHYWPLFSGVRSTALLERLLAEEGVSLAEIGMSWGTIGLPAYTELTAPAGAELYPLHSLGHLFGGLLMDTKIFATETIVALAVDGGPDFGLDKDAKDFWYAGCVSVRGELTFDPVESPALLYAAAKRLFDSEPGTLMALASACVAEIHFDAEGILARHEFYGGRTQPLLATVPFVQRITDEARYQLAGTCPDPRFTDEENLQSAVMKVVQRCCELIMVRNIERLCAKADVDPHGANLSVSGGFALNCPANTRLVDHFGFVRLLTPPCANDSGQALGIGLLGLYQAGILPDADFLLSSAYYGPPCRDLDSALEQFSNWIERTDPFDPEQFVEDLTVGPFAWVQDAAEVGPRALGHRSLIGDPRTLKTKELLNDYKLRQWWRPVAPLVLSEHAVDWFAQKRESPFMLEAVAVREEQRAHVPAIIHLDGSARHQTLARDANPLLHDAISAFHQKTGVPIVCNTSLNDRGEPIVDSAAQALNFCVRKGIRLAYIDGCRVQLRSDSESAVYLLGGPHPRATELFEGQEEDCARIWRYWHHRGYTEDAMFLLIRFPELRPEYKLATAAKVNQLAELENRNDPGFSTRLRRYIEKFGPGAIWPVAARRHSATAAPIDAQKLN
ncbi:carbamoyltransferase C-terminal domain-containing protein [Amycolatopsis halotolerans]|uniref:Carbamoyltransferase C-terminal domain-containing protein n=1 Tax=Amycolatopsis halotolerans TaxID=330083 RepID=A0ABV7QEA5_9PSEU